MSLSYSKDNCIIRGCQKKKEKTVDKRTYYFPWLGGGGSCVRAIVVDFINHHEYYNTRNSVILCYIILCSGVFFKEDDKTIKCR